jgi:hypothetical protein
MVRVLLAKVNIRCKCLKRETNRVLLKLLDFGDVVRPEGSFIEVPSRAWEGAVIISKNHESRFFDEKKFTELHLPIRI